MTSHRSDECVEPSCCHKQRRGLRSSYFGSSSGTSPSAGGMRPAAAGASMLVGAAAAAALLRLTFSLAALPPPGLMAPAPVGLGAAAAVAFAGADAASFPVASAAAFFDPRFVVAAGLAFTVGGAANSSSSSSASVGHCGGRWRGSGGRSCAVQAACKGGQHEQQYKIDRERRPVVFQTSAARSQRRPSEKQNQGRQRTRR